MNNARHKTWQCAKNLCDNRAIMCSKTLDSSKEKPDKQRTIQ
jgi:hypothetical protein